MSQKTTSPTPVEEEASGDRAITTPPPFSLRPDSRQAQWNSQSRTKCFSSSMKTYLQYNHSLTPFSALTRPASTSSGKGRSPLQGRSIDDVYPAIHLLTC